jgi:hypothetical protein
VTAMQRVYLCIASEVHTLCEISVISGSANVRGTRYADAMLCSI